MACRIELITGSADERAELAAFLARIATAGDHPFMQSCDTQAALWLRRFNWWWDANPFCTPASPRGLLLRSGGGAIVGVQALIPQDYLHGPTTVPGLISATVYVEPAHRDASAALLLRFARLARDYHVVDSGPVEKLAQLMERFGATLLRRRHCAYLPLWRHLLASSSSPPHTVNGCRGRFTGNPDEVLAVATGPEDLIVPKITPESLRWQVECGGIPRHFRGWLDESGTLVAWIIAREVRVARINGWGLVGFGGSPALPVSAFLRAAARHPRAAGIPRSVKLLAAYTGRREDIPFRGLYRRNIAAFSYYLLPPAVKAVAKCSLPIDGEEGWL